MNVKHFIKKIYKSMKKKEMIPIEHVISDTRDFEGKVALISGGTGGIGVAIGKTLLECGCKVIFAGTNEKKLEEIKNVIDENVAVVKMDYTKVEKISEVIKEAISIWGKIDVFVNSAGVHTENVDFWTMNSQEFDRVMAINLKGSYFACQEIAKYMRANNIKGHILIISSSRGSEPAWSPYGISKWGLNGFTEGLSELLFPYGIIVNAIAPGSTATSLLGIKQGDSIYSTENRAERLVTPYEVSLLAKFLLSEANKMIVGETIHVSGGRGIFDIR